MEGCPLWQLLFPTRILWRKTHFFLIARTVFSLLHLGLIFFLCRFEPWTTLGGLILYAASLGLFWWAVQINGSAPLSFAFSRDQPQLATALMGGGAW